MQTTLKVRRYDPESGQEASYQSYGLDLPDWASVLEGLLQVREEMDGTLAMRCSCRSAICGSCAMRINGQARLACKTSVSRLVAAEGEEITVEPMGNQPVIKDLVVDMGMFWDKVRQVQPWLRPKSPTPEREYLVPNETMLDLATALNCIMCGACVSDCTVLEIDKSFLGPAALAKAYRFAFDPRDDGAQERLGLYSQSAGMWDCTRCFQCVQVCPKGVAPMEKIMALREAAIDAGFTNNAGTRHTTGFARSIRSTGRLDETRITLRSFGYFNIPALLALVPLGLRALRRGKMPPLFHKAIPSIQSVRRIVDRLEKK